VALHRRRPSVILAARRIQVVLRFMPGHLAAGYRPVCARPADLLRCELPETCPLLEHMCDQV